MATSIINSDDGVVSGTSGLKTTGGNDGVLYIQNNGTTAVTVASTGNATFAQNVAVTGSLSVAGSNISAANSMGFRNRIINGDMRIDQRNAGASVTNATFSYTLDRWNYFSSASSKFTIQQNAGSVTPPAGFTNYLGVTSTAATSVGSTDIYVLTQPIEGYNTSDLGFGSAGAKTVTLSFWVRSSLTGTFGGALRNSAATRAYPFSYTVSVANTWEYKTVTIAGDTTGTWLTTNGTGIQVHFGLGIGSTYSGTAGAWAASDALSPTGATSVVGTSGATFYITGVQLEVGSVATEFERRPYTTELQLCQRYCEVWNYVSGGNGVGTGGWSSSTTGAVLVFYKVPKRTTPSITLGGSASDYQFEQMGTAWRTAGGVSVGGLAKLDSFEFNLTGLTGGTTGAAGKAIISGANGKITVSAEL